MVARIRRSRYVRILLDEDLVGLDAEQRLSLAHDGPAVHQHLGHGAREARVHLVEHLHDLDDVEGVALLEVGARRDERRQVGRLLRVERAAHRGDDLVGLGHRRRAPAPCASPPGASARAAARECGRSGRPRARGRRSRSCPRSAAAAPGCRARAGGRRAPRARVPTTARRGRRRARRRAASRRARATSCSGGTRAPSFS